ncbi:MAG: sugar phosphate isomerase/epimerase [Ruminococcaceae bacterium]|nr:sugar phosphate isomerase/epimerase [Oscillospiraceae bacterium]
MKISTEIASASKIIGEEKAVELIAKAGFDAWDFSMFSMCPYDFANKRVVYSHHPLAGRDYADFSKKLRYIGEECGIVCNQSHAPFPCNNEITKSYLKRAIECTAIAGGEYCIIHPNNYDSPTGNKELFLELLPFAKECGVKIATENMWGWDDVTDRADHAACSSPENFNAHLDEVCDDFLVACLDIGHAEMMGKETNAPEMIRALGKRLKALHIHDNDKWHDSHQIPFSMDIDFNPVVKALKDINYSGYFTLEADQYLNVYDSDNVFEGIKELSQSARKLADMFENM